ncbi:hypothetical protein PDM87_30180 [Bacillus cereus]|nr:hypothetical protein [Bacillus cereus]
MSVMEMAFRATLPFATVGLVMLMIPLTFVVAKLVSEIIMDNGSYMKVKNKKVKSSSEEIDLYKYYSPILENKKNEKENVYVMDHREKNENKYSKGDSEMMKRVFKQNNSVSVNQSGSNSYQREMAKKNNKRNSSSGSSSSDNSSVLLGTAVGVAVASSYYSDSSSSSSSSSYDSGSSCSHDSGSSFDCGGW